jgi:general stress protein YciG
VRPARGSPAHRLHLDCERRLRQLNKRAVPGYAVHKRQEDGVAKENRGFASMDRNKQREIASKGGRAAHEKGTAHEWTREEAREAAMKAASSRRVPDPSPSPGD